MAACWPPWSISPPIGRWCKKDRPRRAHHRPAGRLSQRRHAGRPHRARQGVRLGGQFSTAEAQVLRRERQAARERARHLFHCAAEGLNWPRQSRRADVPFQKSRRSDPPRPRSSRRSRSSISAARAAGPANSATPPSTPWRTASRARFSRDGFKRGDRVAILSANRTEYCRGVLRHHARRSGGGAGQFQVSARRRSISSLRDAGAKLVFCDAARRADCPPGLPAVCFGAPARTGSTNSSIPVRSAKWCRPPDEPAMFLYTSGSTGTPEGRRALPPKPYLGGGDAACRPGPVAAPLSDRGAALSHECAGARAACHARRTPPSCCCRNFTARAYIEAVGTISLHLADRGAADDRHDAARDRAVARRPICRASSSSAWARRRSVKA